MASGCKAAYCVSPCLFPLLGYASLESDVLGNQPASFGKGVTEKGCCAVPRRYPTSFGRGGWKHDNHTLDVDHMRWPPTLWNSQEPSQHCREDASLCADIQQIFLEHRGCLWQPAHACLAQSARHPVFA
jgi:hypothetical protein